MSRVEEANEVLELYAQEQAREQRFFDFNHCLEIFSLYAPYTFILDGSLKVPSVKLVYEDVVSCGKAIFNECCKNRTKDNLEKNEEEYDAAIDVIEETFLLFAEAFERIYTDKFVHEYNQELIGKLWREIYYNQSLKIFEIVNELCLAIEEENEQMIEIGRKATLLGSNK